MIKNSLLPTQVSNFQLEKNGRTMDAPTESKGRTMDVPTESKRRQETVRQQKNCSTTQ